MYGGSETLAEWSISGPGRLRGFNYRALIGKNLVFWMGGGRLREVVAHESWTVS